MSRLDFAQRQLRRSLIVVVLVVCAIGSRALQAFTADAPAPPSGGWVLDQLVNIPNILSLCVLIFHLGVVRQQMSDMRERLKDLEEDLPENYARKDLMRQELDTLKRKLDGRGIR